MQAEELKEMLEETEGDAGGNQAMETEPEGDAGGAEGEEATGEEATERELLKEMLQVQKETLEQLQLLKGMQVTVLEQQRQQTQLLKDVHETLETGLKATEKSEPLQPTLKPGTCRSTFLERSAAGCSLQSCLTTVRTGL